MSSSPEETNQRRKLLLLGTEGVGKTHLVHQLIGENPPEKIKSTIGITQHNIGNESAPISLTDTSGQDRFAFARQELAKKQNMHYCLVYSSDDLNSLNALKEIVEAIKTFDKQATFCLIETSKNPSATPITAEKIEDCRNTMFTDADDCPLIRVENGNTQALRAYLSQTLYPNISTIAYKPNPNTTSIPLNSKRKNEALLDRALSAGILKKKKDSHFLDAQRRANDLHEKKSTILNSSSPDNFNLRNYMKALTYPSYTLWDKRGATNAFMSFLEGLDKIENKEWKKTFLAEVKTALEMLEEQYNSSQTLSRENFSVSKALSLVGAAIEALPQPHNMGAAEPNTH
jgi:GTPase SAR1 family protein